MHAERLERVRRAMVDTAIDVVLLSVGPELPWLVGYEAMPLERLTMLVVPRDDRATLVVPRLEAPRVVERSGLFGLRPWEETEDPVGIVAELVAPAATAAIGDRTWARFVIDLQVALPATGFVRASSVVGPLRARKDGAEVAALAQAAAAADRVAAQLQGGDGHRRVNFAIVAAGPNAASPHHDPGARRIEAGEVVLCDFGGTFSADGGAGYCSDITRCVHIGEPPAELAELYAVLHDAQAAAVAAATVGTPCEEVDAAARGVIADAGYGDRFVHRTGHGIGVEEHEDPYIVAGNATPLEAGHAFSVEPGIYVPGRWGARLEDIVVATPDGPSPLNHADHGLAVVEA
jgi:Xaa-Pro aminopeptidase